MAYDAFLKLDGIKGESADDKHKGEIDILSFSWGVSQTGTFGSGGGGGAGKATVQDLTFVKETDSASPLLFLNCATGTHIKEGLLTVRKAGGTQLEYLKIKLTDILVAKYEESGRTIADGAPAGTTAASMGSADVTTEEFSLNFAKIEYSYQPQGADGKAQGGPILAGYDFKANKKV